MRMKSFPFLLLATAVLIAGCKKEEEPILPIDVSTKIAIDIDPSEDLTGYTLVSMQGEFPVKDGDLTSDQVVGTFKAENPQVIMLVDSRKNVVMMSRDVYRDGEQIVIDAKSSALAMVTLHPLFSPVPSAKFPDLKAYVEASAYFAPLVEEVSKSIAERSSLFDGDNSALLSAFSALLNDLCSEELLDTGFLPFTRASGGITNISGINAGPFKVMLNGLVLGISNYALTPYYDGDVTFPTGEHQEMDIPSNDEYGVTSLLTDDDLSYGDPVTFDFNGKPEGNFVFLFDRTTSDAKLDYWVKLISNILDGLGLPLDKLTSKTLAREVYSYLILDVGLNLATDSRGNILEWMETVTSGVIGFLSSENFHMWAEKNLSGTVVTKLAGQTLFRYLNLAYKFYTLARGSVNSSMLVYYSINQPKNVFFILNYEDGIVKAASSVALQKTGGDNQTGVKGQRLNLPLSVKVLGNYVSDTQPFDAQALCKVRFDVVSGGGSLNAREVSVDDEGKASVYWSLGTDRDTDQLVRAVAVDVATGEVISDPVEFRAGFQSDAAITIRLDWDKTAYDTDIDLHVKDPSGHHIYYDNMRCSCGGYLDRDDIKGPGPEHITYSAAKPGTYEVLVHHYHNGITYGYTVAFTVTAYVGEKVYKSHGAVSYDQMVSLGTFTIGESRSVDVDLHADDALKIVETGQLPAKE